MTVRVKGLNEFRAGLRAAGKELPKAVGKANKKIGERIVQKGAPAVQELSSPGGTASMSGIKPSAQQNKAVIRLTNVPGKAPLFANVFGMKRGRPWLPWIGNSWTPEQLHGLGPVVKEHADRFAPDKYLEAILDALKPAFPD